MHRNYLGDNLLQGRFRFIQSGRTLRFYISNNPLSPHEVTLSSEDLRIWQIGANQSQRQPRHTGIDD